MASLFKQQKLDPVFLWDHSFFYVHWIRQRWRRRQCQLAKALLLTFSFAFAPVSRNHANSTAIPTRRHLQFSRTPAPTRHESIRSACKPSIRHPFSGWAGMRLLSLKACEALEEMFGLQESVLLSKGMSNQTLAWSQGLLPSTQNLRGHPEL